MENYTTNAFLQLYKLKIADIDVENIPQFIYPAILKTLAVFLICLLHPALYNVFVDSLTVKELKSWKDKSRGLLGEKKAYPVLIRTRFGIHTFGMKFSLDIIIINSRHKVVKLKSNLKPNRIFLWSLRYNNVIELPGGDINKRKLKIGDTIRLNLQ